MVKKRCRWLESVRGLEDSLRCRLEATQVTVRGGELFDELQPPLGPLTVVLLFEANGVPQDPAGIPGRGEAVGRFAARRRVLRHAQGRDGRADAR
jgi:hypothetical protein